MRVQPFPASLGKPVSHAQPVLKHGQLQAETSLELLPRLFLNTQKHETLLATAFRFAWPWAVRGLWVETARRMGSGFRARELALQRPRMRAWVSFWVRAYGKYRFDVLASATECYGTTTSSPYCLSKGSGPTPGPTPSHNSRLQSAAEGVGTLNLQRRSQDESLGSAPCAL